MNTKNVWKLGFILFFALVLAGCSFVPPDASGKSEITPETASQREYLAVLKADYRYNLRILPNVYWP